MTSSTTTTTVPARDHEDYADCWCAYWVAEDGQASMPMDCTVREAIDFMLDECRGEEQEEAIMDGSLELVESDWRVYPIRDPLVSADMAHEVEPIDAAARILGLKVEDLDAVESWELGDCPEQEAFCRVGCGDLGYVCVQRIVWSGERLEWVESETEHWFCYAKREAADDCGEEE